jgi:23S rRNA pseudouridine2605 synthase
MTDEPAEPTEDAAVAPGERGERIAKWLARAGVASRRDAEKLLGEGKVRLNNNVVTHPATFVTEGDLVTVGGKLIDQPQRTRLFRYHKREGLMTTHRDPQGRPTVFDTLPKGLPRLISVGRLDLNSEGLLLLTNDGALARQLELPATGWIRRYRVRVFGSPTPQMLASLANGLTVEGVRYGPIEAGLDSRKGDNAWLSIALKEGRNREVRKVMAHLGMQVTRLIRVSYGPFQLGTLPRGGVDEVAPKVLREQLPAERP